jgi:hypothetical protein
MQEVVEFKDYLEEMTVDIRNGSLGGIELGVYKTFVKSTLDEI